MWLLLGLNISESEQSVRCSHVGTQPMARVSLDSVNSGCSQLISALTPSPAESPWRANSPGNRSGEAALTRALCHQLPEKFASSQAGHPGFSFFPL